jgi:hypothetical protein
MTLHLYTQRCERDEAFVAAMRENAEKVSATPGAEGPLACTLATPHQRFARLTSGAIALAIMCHAQWATAASNSSSANARSLPPAGTTWCYSVGSGPVAPMTLKGLESGVANYEVGVGNAPLKIEEKIDTYTPINSSRHGERKLLTFPLAKGKRWSDDFDEIATARLGPDTSWQYHYHAVALSQVIGTEKKQIGAGTFDTFVIERTTTWTKRNPHSSSKMLRAQHCEDASCTVSGFSKEVFWYAPSIGRAVLRAYSQSGDSNYVWNRTPDDMLKDAGTLVTELVGYGSDETCKALHPTLLARTPSSPWYGFPLRMNDTWEFLMTRDMTRE